jgi:hypothetical protein
MNINTNLFYLRSNTLVAQLSKKSGAQAADRCDSRGMLPFPYNDLSRIRQLAPLMSNQSSGFIFKVVERGEQIEKSQRIFAFHTQFWA